MCETCNKLDPTCLHGDLKPFVMYYRDESKESAQNVNSHGISLDSVSCMNPGSCSMSAMILPVYVYALL